ILLYDTGARVQELVDIKIKDLHLEAKNPFIIVTGKGNKTRMVNIPQELANDLLGYRQQRFKVPTGAKDAPGIKDFPVFGGKRDPRRKLHYEEVYRMLKSYSLEILGKKASPHWFRHTFVTHLLGKGSDMKVVSAIVGHGCISTTLKYNQSYHLQNGEVESVFNGEYASVFLQNK
ncbi:MAG: tyrosine-type recombinase/integrase, partial [Desulfonatronovibrio sp.]